MCLTVLHVIIYTLQQILFHIYTSHTCLLFLFPSFGSFFLLLWYTETIIFNPNKNKQPKKNQLIDEQIFIELEQNALYLY